MKHTIGIALLTGLIVAIVATVFISDDISAQTTSARRFYIPYKAYCSRVSQSSTAAPADSVWMNTFGGTWTWARSNAGIYTLTKSGGGITTKAQAFITCSDSSIASAVRTNDSVFTVRTYSAGGAGFVPADGKLTNASFEIRAFP